MLERNCGTLFSRSALQIKEKWKRLQIYVLKVKIKYLVQRLYCLLFILLSSIVETLNSSWATASELESSQRASAAQGGPRTKLRPKGCEQKGWVPFPSGP